MAQSLAKNYIHIVFSTKNREKTIRKEEHHKKADAREELISLLNAYNIEYDDRYI